MTRETGLMAGLGLGIGAGLMYLLDPERGSRRRAIARDKVTAGVNKAGDVLSAAGRDIANRATGLAHDATSLFEESRTPRDRKLHARVRSTMGRYCSHPSAIEVTARDGVVTLSGPILKSELEGLLDAIAGIDGVRTVRNRLEPHRTQDIAALQGGSSQSGPDFELLQENWSPSTRLLMGALGGAVGAWGLSRADALGFSLGAVGLALLTRSATNMEMKSLVGLGGERRSIDLHSSVEIDAPVDEVYSFWRDFENFPRFMSNVESITRNADGTSHWKVKGPAGATVEWDAEVTREIRNELIAWKSIPGSTVENAGLVRFVPGGDGGTHVDVRITYNPPGGAVGKALASLLGSDPRSRMEEDLQRLRSLFDQSRVGSGSTIGIR